MHLCVKAGFAKSRPTVQRPTARRPEGPAACHGPPRPAARDGPAAWRPGGPVLIFNSFFVQRQIHAHAQICIGFQRAKWMTVSISSVPF